MEGWGAECVSSLPRLRRVSKRDLGVGRVLEVARAAGVGVGLVPSRYDWALVDLGFVDGVGGPLVVDGSPADVAVPEGAVGAGVRGCGVAGCGCRCRGSGWCPHGRWPVWRRLWGIRSRPAGCAVCRGIPAWGRRSPSGRLCVFSPAGFRCGGRWPTWRPVCRSCGPRCVKRSGCRRGRCRTGPDRPARL